MCTVVRHDPFSELVVVVRHGPFSELVGEGKGTYLPPSSTPMPTLLTPVIPARTAVRESTTNIRDDSIFFFPSEMGRHSPCRSPPRRSRPCSSLLVPLAVAQRTAAHIPYLIFTTYKVVLGHFEISPLLLCASVCYCCMQRNTSRTTQHT